MCDFCTDTLFGAGPLLWACSYLNCGSLFVSLPDVHPALATPLSLTDMMDLVLVRAYLKLAPRQDADAVLRDAIVVQEPGAVQLLRFVLQMRVNRRTRRTVARANAA